MARIKMSFWNYVQTGQLKAKEAVKDWEELSINLAMSFNYNPKKHKKKEMFKLLNECNRRGMKVIICDERTDFRFVSKIGREAFEKGVAEAVKDFGAHPATFGFHVGDEPNKNSMDDAIFAHKTVKAAAPHLTPFLNLLPLWIDGGFEDSMGCKEEEYGAFLDKLVKDAGLEILCYDCYAQCASFEKEKYQEVYLRNLSIFGKAAKDNGIQLFTSLLSVAHWSLYCPSEDDFRWQISTAAAMGCSGFVWFFIYERFWDLSFRMAPIDLFWKRTETFERLARQNRIFMQFLAPRIDDYQWEGVKTVNMEIYGQEQWKKGDFGIKEIQLAVNENAPLIIAKFKGEKDDMLFIVNAERELPASIQITHKNGETDKKCPRQWLAPGEIMPVRVK